MKILLLMAVCILIVLVVVGLKNYKYISKRAALAAIIALVFFLLLGKLATIAMATSYSRDILIEVTEEKNELSKGVDIGITSIAIDHAPIDLTGRQISGDWRRSENVISWGYSVEKLLRISVPVYSRAEITFKTNVWGGLVRVTANGKSEVFDLYSAEDGTYVFQVDRVPFTEAFPKLLPILLVLLSILAAVGLLSWQLFIDEPKGAAIPYGWKILAGIRKRPALLIRAAVLTLTFLLMLTYAGEVSLWSDDLATISFVAEGESLQTIIKRVLSDSYSNPPLFYIFAYFWLRIAPYGTVWLKLISIVFSCCGIWLCGTAAKKISGERAAVAATIFAGTSWFLVKFAAFTFRCYGLLFMLCPITLLAYQNRLEKPRSVRAHIWYGLLLALMAYTNYIALLAIAAMGLYDCWRFVHKRVRWSFLYSYIGAGILFLPYLPHSPFFSIIKSDAEFWPAVPDIRTLIDLINTIFSGQAFLEAFFIVGVFAAVAICCVPKCRDHFCGKIRCVETCSAAAMWVIFVVGFGYVFSRYISPSSSMFVKRYFIVVLAPLVIVAAVGMDWLLEVLCEKKSSNFIRLISALLLAYCFVIAFNKQVYEIDYLAGTINQPYEEAIDWIYTRQDAHRDDAVVIFTGRSGGFYYYGTHGGARPNLNFGSLNEENWEKYQTVFTSPMHGALSSECQRILDSYFEKTETVSEWNLSIYKRKN